MTFYFVRFISHLKAVTTATLNVLSFLNVIYSISQYSDGIISALSSDPHTPIFNRNSTCLTFQKENAFMFFIIHFYSSFD